MSQNITVGSITFGQILTHDELPNRFTSIEEMAVKSDAIPERKVAKQEALIQMLRLGQEHLTKENETLRAQLAECQKDKSDSEHWFKQKWVEQQARIAELRQDLECISNGVVCPEIAARQTLSRTDNMEALNAYRDRVLEDAARIVERNAPEQVGEPNGYGHSAWSERMGIISRYHSMAAAIRALKKGLKGE